MPDADTPDTPGTAETPVPLGIEWNDLTVPDAEALVPFYSRVVGFEARPVPMRDGGETYDDYTLCDPVSGEVRAGLCHARGPNAGLPPVWVPYVRISDFDASLSACVALGGEIVDGPRPMAGQRFALVRDPAGAYIGLLG